MSKQMKIPVVMQGDSYGLEIEILNADKEAVTDADVSDVEITIGSIRKTYAKNELSFESGKWVFPMTQKESFKLPVTHVKAQVRVMWPDGSVEGVSLGIINIYESISREVL